MDLSLQGRSKDGSSTKPQLMSSTADTAPKPSVSEQSSDPHAKAKPHSEPPAADPAPSTIRSSHSAHQRQGDRSSNKDEPDADADQDAPHTVRLERGGHRRPPAVLRWTRKGLAECWACSERKVDRLRDAGILGTPIGFVGKSPIWSDEQRLAAERAGLQAKTTPQPQP
jgi:hypothetical protein